MPTKARKARERAEQRRIERLSNPPAYIKARVEARRVRDEKTWSSEFLEAPDQDPARTRLGNGLVTVDERGDLLVRSDLMRKNQNSANDERHDRRKQDVVLLRTKYQSTWGKRGVATAIAAREGLCVRTVQKYFKDFP